MTKKHRKRYPLSPEAKMSCVIITILCFLIISALYLLLTISIDAARIDKIIMFFLIAVPIISAAMLTHVIYHHERVIINNEQQIYETAETIYRAASHRVSNQPCAPEENEETES